MTNEEKQLLLKDLCGRFPYGVKILDLPANVVGDLFLISTTDTVEYETNDDTGYQTLHNIKPYLRPMSSMTEEEKEEYCNLQDKFLNSSRYPVTDAYEIFDWLNRKGFDYRGLIPLGLALKANEGMYEG